MKTEQTLRLALAKYKSEQATIGERLESCQMWLDAASFMQAPDLFVAQVKERDELRRRETETDFRIRFTEWVLENEKPKEKKNEED